MVLSKKFLPLAFLFTILFPQISSVNEAIKLLTPTAQAETFPREMPLLFLDKKLAQNTEQENLIQITGLQLNPNKEGLEILLETSATGIQPLIIPQDNTLVIEVLDAVLRLPEGPQYTALDPNQEIAEVKIFQQDERTVRIVIVGKTGVPSAQVLPADKNLVLSVTTSEKAATAEELEVIATQEAQNNNNYYVPEVTGATRTQTPILNVPQSIGMVTEQLIQDRGVDNVGQAVETVSGVNNLGNYGGYEAAINIRGFFADTFQGSYFKDGLRLFTFGFPSLANIERIEVIKGPASVLYGQAQPGGIINFVTKKPLDEPYYAVTGSLGNFDTYEATIDMTGPLTPDKSLLYRLNIGYRDAQSFRDFVEGSQFLIAPVLTWNISPFTSLRLNLEYLYNSNTMDDGIVAIGDRPANVPISRFLNEPFSLFDKDELSFGYAFEHRFSENWQIKNAFRAQFIYPERYYPLLDSVDEETGEVSRIRYNAAGFYENYALQTDVIGKFKTGPIQHELLIGFEYNHTIEQPDFGDFEPYPPINLFDPVYTNEPFSKEGIFTFFRDDKTTTWGIYIQDQIQFFPNLILLIGGRYDIFDQDRSTQNIGEARQSFSQSDSSFSPRVGLVYKPIDIVSLYASYSRSFRPSFGASRNFDDSPFEPETGTQYEIGVKTELLNRRLGMTLAAFYLTKENVTTEDPNDPQFSIQTGEQTSKGIEFEVNGEVLPGWQLSAAATYLDARITRDNTLEVGNWLDNVPEFSASLWSTYEIQTGSLQGLGFGLGLFYVGDRYGDLDNSFILPSYFRTDAALYYRRDNWRAQLNIRNLFDSRYFSGSSSSRVNVQPGAPFTVLGTLSLEF